MTREESSRGFLADSTLAQNTRIPVSVVLDRMSLSAQDLAEVRRAATYRAAEGVMAACEMEAGGQIVATGRIVRRKGRYYLKVTEVAEVGEDKGGEE